MIERDKLESKVRLTFEGNISKQWDIKEKIVHYHGHSNPITSMVINTAQNGMKIIDIGCGTGQLIGMIDHNIKDGFFTGIDISHSMINLAKSKKYTENNSVIFICDSFTERNFNDDFDIVIMKNFLHHVKNPKDNIKKAASLLNSSGKLFMSVPTVNYLKELFYENELNGRFQISELNNLIDEVNLFPLSIYINRVAMSFDSYEYCIKYLKSIGTYAKVNNYSNNQWDKELNELIIQRYNNTEYITGEYVTYECINKKKVLKL